MRTLFINFWRELRYFFGLKGIWAGRIAGVLVSLLTAFAMGLVYAFSTEAQEAIGVENVAIYLLTGFFMQYLIYASISGAPSKMLTFLRWDAFEYLTHYNFNVFQHVAGIYFGLFMIDFVVALPFLIGLAILVSQTISFLAMLSFIGFLLVMAICLLSVGLLFSALILISKNAQGYIQVIGNIVTFICGVYFPIQGYLTMFGNIGGWFAIGIVSIFPHTYIYDLSRFVIFMGDYTTIFPIWLELILLFVTSTIFLLIALLLFKVGIKKWRNKGFKSYIY